MDDEEVPPEAGLTLDEVPSSLEPRLRKVRSGMRLGHRFPRAHELHQLGLHAPVEVGDNPVEVDEENGFCIFGRGARRKTNAGAHIYLRTPMAVAVYRMLRPLTSLANAHRFDVRLFGRRFDFGMGRLVWFSPPLLASGFGAPARCCNRYRCSPRRCGLLVGVKDGLTRSAERGIREVN